MHPGRPRIVRAGHLGALPRRLDLIERGGLRQALCCGRGSQRHSGGGLRQRSCSAGHERTIRSSSAQGIPHAHRLNLARQPHSEGPTGTDISPGFVAGFLYSEVTGPASPWEDRDPWQRWARSRSRGG